MPAYGTPQVGGNLPTAVSPGDSFTFFNAETPAAGTASIPMARASSPSGDDSGTTFQAIFPGGGSVQIQASNVDQDAAYVNVGTAIAASGGFYTDINRFAFYRAQAVSLTSGTLTVIAQR